MDENLQKTLSKSCMKTEQFLFTVKRSLYSVELKNLTTKLRKPIRDNPKIFTKSEKMFLKSEKTFQIVMFFGNRRRRVYQI